jgi:hypothetical protein
MYQNIKKAYRTKILSIVWFSFKIEFFSEKAFNLVSNTAENNLKLLLNNINGKMYKVIYNMYQNIKPRIVYNNAVYWFCISSFDSDIITVSSAYKSTKSFKYISSSLSKSSVIDVRPF